MSPVRLTLVLLAAAPLLSGCAVAAATGAVINTTGAVVGTAARTTGRAVGAVIPDGDDDDNGGNGAYPDTAGAGQSGAQARDGDAPRSYAGGGYTRADAVAAARGR